jgi:hypothetical protein
MRICTFGLLATDATYIYVYRTLRNIPGAYRYLLVGPVIEGFLGGKHSSFGSSEFQPLNDP